jgi:elongation factor Ts
MAITAKDVMDLRNKTGLGMMECKAALGEANGDIQAAIDLLRKKGLAKMDSRTDRASAEGRVAVSVLPDKTKGAIVEVNTETDFTAKNDAFARMMQLVVAEALKQPAGEVVKTDAMQKAIDDVRITTKENVQFARGRVVGGPGRTVGTYVHFTGKIGVLIELEGAGITPELLTDLCQHVAAASPTPIGVTEADVPADVVEKEKQIAKAQAIEQGKPEQIAEKMVIGKIRKFYEEHVLMQQIFIKDDKKRIKDILPKGVTIKSFVRYQLGVK